MNTRQKLALGSALAVISGTGTVLSAMRGWSEVPWVDFLLGIAVGTGATLAIAGLLEHRRAKSDI